MKYKLTDKNDQTQGETQWGEGITHTAKKGHPLLCSDTIIHYYDHPLLAVLLNPIHACIKEYHLWEAKGKRAVHDGLKGGAKSLTTIRRIEPPVVTTEQRVRFAIYCAMEVYTEPSFVEWANCWLSGEDRTVEAADVADAAARASSWWASEVVEAARAAVWASSRAAEVVDAARAARAAAEVRVIDFAALVQKAIRDEG